MTDSNTQPSANAGQGNAGAGTPSAGGTPAAGTTTPEPTSVMGSKPGNGAGASQPGANGSQGGTQSAQPVTGAGQAAELTVTLPDGVRVDEGLLQGFKTVAGEVGLDSEKASKVAAWYAQANTAREAAELKAWQEQSNSWAAALKADPQFGGSNWQASLTFVDKAMAKFGGPELRAELERMGLVNNPVLAKTFRAIGEAISEDQGPAGDRSSGSSGTPTREQALAALFNKTQPTKA